MSHRSLAWLNDALTELEAAGLRRRRKLRGEAQAARLQVDGRELLNFGSNDYLGLAARRLNAAATDAITADGWGAGASPLVIGRGRWHAALETALADFEGTEAALLFPSGFAANVGAIGAVVGAADVIFSDAKNHASIIDGCRLSGATIQIYRHRDWLHLAEQLQSAGHFRRRLIVTDSLFSMDGDFAPLPELCELAAQYQAMLMVDEAHATGVLGPHGRGVAELYGCEDGVDIRVGTLSKALGSSGGFVAGSEELIEWLWNRARPYVFSTAAPEAAAAAALEALRIVRTEPQLRRGLLDAAAEVRRRLSNEGWNVADSTSQIIPVMIGDARQTMCLAAELDRRGLYVPGIRPPSVPPGESLLRISLTAAHTPTMLDRLIDEFHHLRTLIR